MESIASDKSSTGAQNNALEHIISYNESASLKMASGRSSLIDLDIETAMLEKQKGKILEQYQIFAQKEAIENNNRTIFMEKMFV